MQDSKEITWASDYDDDAAEDPKANDREINAQAGDKADADGWQQYRRWISKAPAPRGRRTGVDPTLYTLPNCQTRPMQSFRENSIFGP